MNEREPAGKLRGAGDETIRDFGEQWQRFPENEGYYGSLELLKDILEPLISVEEIRGLRIADIGSGTGRIVCMLQQAGAAEITAIEPSDAFHQLAEKTRDMNVTCIHATGDKIPQGDYDIVLSIGVIHHIPEPDSVLSAAYQAIRPGGRCLIWLYGREGNEIYLLVSRVLRAICHRMPRQVVKLMAWGLVLPLSVYAFVCRFVPLPMRQYFNSHISRLSWRDRRLTIYDQLNPTWAEYYDQERAHGLLSKAGFVDIRSHHRHGYSWTVVGTKSP